MGVARLARPAGTGVRPGSVVSAAMTHWSHEAADVTAVMHRYAQTIDRRQFDRLRTCFTDDCTWHGYPGVTPETAPVGSEAIVGWISSRLGLYGRTQHFLGQVIVELDGERARSEAYVQAYHLLADDPTQVVHLFGSYLDEYRKVDGLWTIDRHELDLIHIEKRPANPR